MLLSSLAWKIRCAFTSGRSGAPSEFREVEEELISLQTSITSLADTLDKDDSILSRADQDTQEGLQKILSSCCEVGTQSLMSARTAVANASLRPCKTWSHLSISIKRSAGQKEHTASLLLAFGRQASSAITKSCYGRPKAGTSRLFGVCCNCTWDQPTSWCKQSKGMQRLGIRAWFSKLVWTDELTSAQPVIG